MRCYWRCFASGQLDDERHEQLFVEYLSMVDPTMLTKPFAVVADEQYCCVIPAAHFHESIEKPV